MTIYDPKQCPIAIVGASAIFPGSLDKTGFWTDILDGRDLITDIPASHWLTEDYYDPDPAAPDKTYARRGAFLDATNFDPLEWGVPPSIVPATDTTQLLALIVAKRVLEDASQGSLADIDTERMSCILGVTGAQELLGTMVNRLQRPVWTKALRELGYAEDEVVEICDRITDQYVPWQESTFPGLLGNVVAGRIANRLDLGGTNCVTDAACASSFSAISMAVNELWLGQSDVVITGGCDTMNDIFMYMCFSKTPALSPSGECRPFSDKADGTLLGEGLGMVALKRLPDAEREGDRIYAVLKGVGASSDGRSKSVYAPVAKGQARALRRAYDQAGYGPETVELVEAHGTGTKAGDAAEFEGLRIAFTESGRQDSQWCALGTVKSQIGHTKAAAGAAGLFKVMMSLHHKVLPPTIKIDKPNPKLEIERSPFFLNDQSRPWVRSSAHARRGSVSSFGFGGSNFHLALEEYTGPNQAWRLRRSPTELVVLAADSPAALSRDARGWADRADVAGFLTFAARTTQLDFDADKPSRLAVVARDESDLVKKLRRLADRIDERPEEAFDLPTGSYYATGAQPGKVAFLFPGQGSQYLNMGAELAIACDSARAAFDAAADLRFDEEPLHRVVFPPPVFDEPAAKRQSAKLRSTEWAQPAIGVTSLAVLGVLDALGIHADTVGGHSYGEITALCAAGAISPMDCLRVARRRGELMAEAAKQDGAMIAVPRTLEEVRPFTEAVDGAVLANHNSPTQIVVSGPTDAVESVERALLAAGIEPKRLRVATAFHTSVVAESVEPFRAFLDKIDVVAPRIPVYHNPEAAPHASDPDEIRSGLATAIARPVRFVEQIEAMYDAGMRTFIEVGPGHVLTNLVGEILADRPHTAIHMDRRKKHGLTSLHHALGRMCVTGLRPDLASLWAQFAPIEDPHDARKPRMSMPVNGSNYDKPYPPKGGAAALPGPNPTRTGAAKAREPAPQVQVVEKVVEKVVEVPVAAPSSLASVPPGAPMSTEPADPWILAFQEAQRATVEAHNAYQAAMADSHGQFLRTVEASLNGLTGLLTGQPAAAPASPMSAHAAVAMPAMPARQMVSLPAETPPELSFASESAHSNIDITSIVQSGVEVLSAAAAPSPTPVVAPVAAGPALDLEALMLDVVSEKTGYPADMLEMGMALESDLGIDSIKRVEILSAVRERAPGLPEVDAGAMAKLQTLGEVTDFLRASAPAAHAQAPVPAAAQGVDLEALMLEVVSEKTGYPADMLEMGMALESDLGIDSIKRVEILSAVRERAPGLPEVDAGAMAKLQTLGEVTDYLRASTPTAPGASAPPTSAAPDVDLEALMLEVVSEKTGYPADMLELGMALESDLGIDSIKRVEILSAVRERAPGLPEVDAGAMAKLQTLGEVTDYLRASAPAASAPPTAAQAPSVDLEALMLDVVSEKTGYPADMLELGMALESDLGIDSIKRVEILSAVRERAPGLPEVDAGAMAKLQTLGEVVDYLRATAPGAAKPTAAAPEPVIAQAPPLGRWHLEAVPAPAAGLSLSGISASATISVTPSGSLADALVTALTDEGLSATASDDPATNADVVLFVGGATEFALPEEAMAIQRAAFLCARAIAPRFADAGLFVTVQDTGGDFGLAGSDRAWIGGLPGLVKTVDQEWPGAACKAIDIERGGRPDADVAVAIVAELISGGAEVEVGLKADGTRVALRSVASTVAPTAALIDAHAVVVASGGARGVTAHTLIELARTHGGRYALLGRTTLDDEPAALAGAPDEASLKSALLTAARAAGEKPTPADINKRVWRVLGQREIRATLAAIEGAGGAARYISVDVTDQGALDGALATVRGDWGPITAVVHGAGVLADKLVADKTPEQFDRVFDTKVKGLRALLAATADDPVTTMVMFSSVAGRCGNRGQCDYAMANEVLAKVAALEQARRGTDCVVKALQWGPWEAGMVTPELKAHFAAAGVPLIPLDEGARMLVNEIADRSGHVELVLGGEPRMGPLAIPGADRAVTVRMRVDQRSHPYLADHQVAGVPVVPVVFALEWFARAAAACRPDLCLTGFSDIKVLSGIKLSNFHTGGDWFDVSAREVSNGVGAILDLELRSEGGRVHYRAQAQVAPHREPAPVSPEPVPMDDWGGGAIYDGRVLFHGDTFQVIRSLDGVSDKGIAATLTSTAQAGWGDEPWHTDPAALDGGLQLALLWTDHVLGGASLPMGVGTFRTFLHGSPTGPLTAVLTGEKRSRDKTVADIVFIDQDGVVVHELRGVEAILRPDA